MIVWGEYKVVQSWSGYILVYILLALGIYLLSDFDFFLNSSSDKNNGSLLDEINVDHLLLHHTRSQSILDIDGKNIDGTYSSLNSFQTSLILARGPSLYSLRRASNISMSATKRASIMSMNQSERQPRTRESKISNFEKDIESGSLALAINDK